MRPSSLRLVILVIPAIALLAFPVIGAATPPSPADDKAAPAVSSTVAPAAPPTRAKRRCRGGLKVEVDRRRRCLRRATLRGLPETAFPIEPSVRRAQAIADRPLPLKRRLGRKRARHARRLLTAFEAALAEANAGAPHRAPAARARLAQGGALELPELEGWTARATVTPADPNPLGGAEGGEGRVEATTTRGHVRLRVVETAAVTSSWSCPDEQGNVTGVVRRREETRVIATDTRTGRVLESRRRSWGFEGTLEAHVDEGARLVDYDLLVDVRVDPGHSARAGFTGLPPLQPWRIAGDGTSIRWGGDTGQEYNPWEIGDGSTRSLSFSTAGAERLDPNDDLALALLAMIEMAKWAADKVVEAAFFHWYALADCVTVAYTPPGAQAASLEVTRGEPKTLRVEARSRLDRELIGGTVEHDNDLGTVTPAQERLHPGVPGALTIVARRKPASSEEGLLTRGLSRRGRIQGNLRVRVRPRYAPPSFSGTTSGTFVRSIGITESWEATVTFHLTREDNGIFYYVPRGTVTYTTSGNVGGCSLSGTGTYTLDRAIDGTLLVRPLAERTDYFISGHESDFGGQDPQGYPVTVTCPDDTGQMEWNPNVKWVETRVPWEEAPRDARTLSGQFSRSQSNGRMTWRWNLSGG